MFLAYIRRIIFVCIIAGQEKGNLGLLEAQSCAQTQAMPTLTSATLGDLGWPQARCPLGFKGAPLVSEINV